jgi:hypothetical protein
MALVLSLEEAFSVAMGTACAENRVRGYTKKNGTVVQPHHRVTTPEHRQITIELEEIPTHTRARKDQRKRNVRADSLPRGELTFALTLDTLPCSQGGHSLWPYPLLQVQRDARPLRLEECDCREVIRRQPQLRIFRMIRQDGGRHTTRLNEFLQAIG